MPKATVCAKAAFSIRFAVPALVVKPLLTSKNSMAACDLWKGSRVAKTLSDGSTEWDQAKENFTIERQKLEKERKELSSRVQWRDTIYSVIILAGAVASGVLLGYTLKR
jgi:hypothetical protein